MSNLLGSPPDSPVNISRKHWPKLCCGRHVARVDTQSAPADAGPADAGEPEDDAVMNRARPLVSETSYLRLARDQHDAEVVAAVRELDTRLAEPEPPPAITNVEKFLAAQMGVTEARSPHSSPVTVGTLERAQCNYDLTKTAYIYRGVGGNDIIVRFPILADDPEVDACIRDLVDLVNEKLERRWADRSRDR